MHDRKGILSLLLAFLFVVIHQGFRWPSGTMGWLLLVLSFWAAVSGLAGVWLQKWVPAMMASGLSVEALLEKDAQQFTAKLHHIDGKKAEIPNKIKTKTAEKQAAERARNQPNQPVRPAQQPQHPRLLGTGARRGMAHSRAGQRFYRAVSVPAPADTNLVFIQPGTFTMGSPTNEVVRFRSAASTISG